VAALYRYIASPIGAAIVTASPSDIQSIWPVNGAQYHCPAELSPAKMGEFVSLYVGWLSNAALWLRCPSARLATATQINAYIVICNPDYIPERYHTLLMFVTRHALPSDGLVSRQSPHLSNIYHIKLMGWLNIGAMIVHSPGFILVIVVLSVIADHHDLSFAFTSFQKNLADYKTGLPGTSGS